METESFVLLLQVGSIEMETESFLQRPRNSLLKPGSFVLAVSNLIRGSHLLAGSNLLAVSNLLVGNNLLAGSSLLAESSLLAGSNLLVGNNLLAESSLLAGSNLLGDRNLLKAVSNHRPAARKGYLLWCQGYHRRGGGSQPTSQESA